MRGGESQETLGVDDGALLGFGNDLVGAAGDIPTAPAAFTVTGGDAISQKISSLLPQIEGPIIAGLPQVKNEAKGTADRIVGAAQTYQRVDEQIAQMISDTELGGPAGGATGTGGSGGGTGGGAAASDVQGAASSSSPASGSSSGSGSGSGATSQMMSTPMQLASQAAQLPMQAVGALAAVPQALSQGVAQVVQMASGTGDDTEKPTDEAKPAEEAAAEQPGERAPLAPPPTRAGRSTDETNL